MRFTPRMRQIFQVLLKEPSAISVRQLAEQIGVSRRTVQRELEYISTPLNEYGLTFVSKTGVGIWIEGKEEDKQQLLADSMEGDGYDVGNREERRKRLILEILKEKGLRKLYYYSSQFGVSEATVSTDLEAVEGWLGKYGLTVGRKPGSGISIEGSEESYRRAIRAFIDENIDTRVVREAYGEEGGMLAGMLFADSNVGKILDDRVMERVVAIVQRIGHERIRNMTENSYKGLLIHIAIAIDRILKQEMVEDTEAWKQADAKDEDYRLAKRIVEELEQEFQVSIPEVEVSYICLHIKGAKHERIAWDEEKSLEIESREMQQLVNDMIDAFDPEQGYLMKQDDGFIQGLLAHLQPTLVRLVYGMQIPNPVLEDIKDSYPDMYRSCEKVAKVLEAYTGKQVPEQEIGFLTVHFGAAMVRLEGRKEEIRKVQAGVVCSSGIGISRLMSSKLEKVFRGRMELAAYGKKDITPYIAGKTDFFISSIPMDGLGVPVVYVNPLLSEGDIEKIRQTVYKYERLPGKHKGADGFSSQLEEINLMAAQIGTVIKYMDFFKVDNRISFGELLIAIGERLSPYSDRQEMIREDILRREHIASQVFAEFGFALLHARTKGVTRPEFSICMTKDLGAFSHPYFKGIKMVFVMLVPMDGNLKVNTDIMGYISSMMIEEYEFMDVVARGDKEEIRGALSQHLKRYFNRYIGKLA